MLFLAYRFVGFGTRDKQNYTAKFRPGTRNVIKQRQRKYCAVLGSFYEEKQKPEVANRDGQFFSKDFQRMLEDLIALMETIKTLSPAPLALTARPMLAVVFPLPLPV